MLSGVALLAACATPPRPAAGEAPWIAGRMAVQIAATPQQAAQSLSAGFELRGSDHSGELRLNTPLGTRLAVARWSPGLAVLDDGQGEQRYASLDELARRALGESLPLAALPDWLAGRPWAAAPHRAVDTGFEQLGWRVDLSRQADGFISAAREAPPAVQVRIKLEAPG